LPLTPYTVERFGALNLVDDPLEVGATGATEVVNVDFDRQGRVRTRDGYLNVVVLTGTSADGLATFENSAGLKQFVVAYQNGGTKKYEAYSSTGGAAIVSAAPTNTRLNWTRFGTLVNEYLYIGNGLDTVWRWDGAAFTQPAGMPTALYLAVDANSNRLVAAHTDNGSKVQFSDPGAPETFGADNYVVLTPGDGTKIGGLASWQDYVFAFKQRRFFVFTGESVDADGGPIFNYRTIDGYGTIVTPITGDEGVYFFDGRTVWLTTGDVPVRVSRNIEPFIRGLVAMDSAFVGYTIDQTLLLSAQLSYANGRLYLSLLTTSSSVPCTLVYDPKIDAWTFYTTRLRWASPLRTASTDLQSVFWLSDDLIVNKFSSNSTADHTTVFNWQYTSGHYDMGYPGQTKVTRESRLWGYTQGVTATLKMSADGTYDTGSALTLGGGTDSPGNAWQQIDREATLFRHRLQGGADGRVVINRLVHYLSFVKPAGIE
jgi:hypothetical protein